MAQFEFIFICFPPLIGQQTTVYVTFEVEDSHCQAALSYCFVEVVKSQVGDGVHVRHFVWVFVN